MTPEEVRRAQDELNSLFVTLQKIDAPMTENNIVVMNACLGSVKFLHNFIGETNKERGSDNGDADAE